MATTYKVLGQSSPAATTATTLYTVPAATSAVVSTLSVCNTTAAGVTVRLAVRPAGAALATAHYLAYDLPAGGKETITLTLGITLAATDVVTVYASAADVVFHAYGSELT